jgi:hypothetical protein
MNTATLKPFLLKAAALLQRLLRPFGWRPTRMIAGTRFQFDPTTDIGLHLLVFGAFEPTRWRSARISCARTES